jgi:Required for nuclear transport of RNA pol II C-terminus 1/Required for nuclear transport of RNA pol II C-terminus 2
MLQQYQTLSNLTRGQAPEWFRSCMAHYLAILPTKPNGVRWAIEFIASSFKVPNPPNGSKDDASPSKGAGLPAEAVNQMAKVLSAVPRSMKPEDYLSQIAPQLLHLLDGGGGPELGQVAGYIIASGILGKRALGAPGSPGWKTFAEPLALSLNPSPLSRSGSISELANKQTEQPLDSQITSEAQLDLALKRLGTLILSHPNPNLTGRLLGPLVLPLWAIANYDGSPSASSEAPETAFSLLETFFTLAGNLQSMLLITTNLLWDGGSGWTLGPGSEAGISIRHRNPNEKDANLLHTISRIDQRVAQFLRLASTGAVDDNTIGAVFLHLSRQWLLSQESHSNTEVLGESSDDDPVKSLTNGRLVQGLLEKFKDKIAKDPANILDLIQQLLLEQVESQAATRRRIASLTKPTYIGLSSIVGPSGDLEMSDASGAALNDPSDVINVTLSLLSAIMSTPGFKRDQRTGKILGSIVASLRSLATDLPNNSTLSQTIQAVIFQIQSPTTTASSTSSPRDVGSLRTQPTFQESFALIQRDITSDLPPVRGSALNNLLKLIYDPKIVVDVPATTVLLLHAIRTDPEDYVHLAAIKALVDLAILRDLRITANLTINSFHDVEEKADVDGRLRVGEALSRMVEQIGEHQHQAAQGAHRRSILRAMISAMASVAGRRGQRKREQSERKKRERLEKAKKREAEKAWGGEVPDLPSEDNEESDEEGRDATPEAKQRRLNDLQELQTIVQGWQDTGFEEDIRIRTSALSIIGSTILHGLSDLSSERLDVAIDIAHSILIVEPSASKAILRRAAALVFLSLLQALDNALEENREGHVGLETGKWAEVEKVLEYVRDMDADGLTREYAGNVLEGLENYRMKRVVKVRDQGLEEALRPRLGLEGQLRGLEGMPAVDDEGVRKPKIEEVE